MALYPTPASSPSLPFLAEALSLGYSSEAVTFSSSLSTFSRFSALCSFYSSFSSISPPFLYIPAKPLPLPFLGYLLIHTSSLNYPCTTTATNSSKSHGPSQPGHGGSLATPPAQALYSATLPESLAECDSALYSPQYVFPSTSSTLSTPFSMDSFLDQAGTAAITTDDLQDMDL